MKNERASFVPTDASASTEDETGQLQRLYDQVAELSKQIADRLDQTTVAGPAVADFDPQRVITLVRARELRDDFFGSDLFNDPAWDILLHLLLAELRQRRVTVTELSTAGNVAATTGLRWIAALVKKGMLIRIPDPRDGRRVYVALTADASLTLRRYFAEVACIDRT